MELHCHGSPAVVKKVLSSLSDLDGFRHAEPGEFSRRAFYNDKMDLTEAEGTIDLINSQTEAQRNIALKQMSGVLNEKYNNWRVMLMRSLAHIEAVLDFQEDEEIDSDLEEKTIESINNIKQLIINDLEDTRGIDLREGIKIGIFGPPNAGKSSLLNNMAKRDVAIVSPIKGTTRDVVDVSLDIGGYPIILSDTAGILESTDDPIEMIGISRAKDKYCYC